MTTSLYIHIPFCTGTCGYCDFFSVPLNANHDAALLDTFIEALLDDIEDQLALFHVDQVPTVYIGGGTPSVLGPIRMERLLGGIAALLKTAPGEFTVEANPESADGAFLRVCSDGGVNRISLGIQTFHGPSRRLVHRIGSGSLLEERLTLSAQYFPGAFSADLITGLPLQTTDILLEDINRLLTYKPAHVSLYTLTLEPQTPLGRQAAQLGAAAISLPQGDDADNLWIIGSDALEANGLTQYEVSNFALSDKTCAHNIRYWRMENWLGAGPAASGTIIDDATGSGRRFSYPENIQAYIAAPRPRIHQAHVEELGWDELIRESLLMGFRYRGGPDRLRFKQRFGCGIEDCIPTTIAKWRERGFFAGDAVNLTPSRGGLLFLNSFLRDAFGELV
jgi:oxygen-independent coproporphyrinogen-3 oxidase